MTVRSKKAFFEHLSLSPTHSHTARDNKGAKYDMSADKSNMSTTDNKEEGEIVHRGIVCWLVSSYVAYPAVPPIGFLTKSPPISNPDETGMRRWHRRYFVLTRSPPVLEVRERHEPTMGPLPVRYSTILTLHAPLKRDPLTSLGSFPSRPMLIAARLATCSHWSPLIASTSWLQIAPRTVLHGLRSSSMSCAPCLLAVFTGLVNDTVYML